MNRIEDLQSHYEVIPVNKSNLNHKWCRFIKGSMNAPYGYIIVIPESEKHEILNLKGLVIVKARKYKKNFLVQVVDTSDLQQRTYKIYSNESYVIVKRIRT